MMEAAIFTVTPITATVACKINAASITILHFPINKLNPSTVQNLKRTSIPALNLRKSLHSWIIRALMRAYTLPHQLLNQGKPYEN